MIRTINFALVVLLVVVGPGAQAAPDLKAAAALAGVTAGMAAGCGLDSKPVLFEFRSLLDRNSVSSLERERLNQIVIDSSALGLKMQKEPSSMPCSEVRSRMRSTIETLRSAR